MDMQYDILRATLAIKLNRLFINKLVSFITFTLLIANIIFIEIHPYSVWYYFFAGFFCYRLIGLAVEKSELKFHIQKMMHTLNQLKKGFL